MWEESGAFTPRKDADKSPFSIIMPPPNANGNLHTGHAMFTVEDIMVRYRRMQGHPTLWLPGTDHAGIETQVVFERELAKEGKSRFDFTPEEFYKAALEYTKGNQHNIIGQLKSLGFSADWSRLQFTLDEKILETVHETFIELLKDGHVYRGNRIVNWCPHCHSSFADIEVKYRTQIDPLYYLKYGPFVLATVRPETKFGDTAVAVHPEDERYKKYIGKTITFDGLLGSVQLKVIADTHVNPDFGTGVVKVTPAHDPNDWEMGQRHKLEVKQVIGTDGKLTSVAGKYAGMKVGEARDQVAKDLEEAGLIDHIDMNYSHSVAYHDRCGTQIEPLVTEQWWVDVSKLKQPAIEAVKSGEIEIVPARFKKVYIDWLENLRDWNISRQNWFGIRMPVYYNSHPNNGKDAYRAFSHENEAIKYYGEGGYERETDTFDTWFSSSQWPYATLKASGDFDQFYPTSVMETGRDILFQWVTRMVMFGIYKTGKVPFKTIYLHGLVNDAHGKKMSKSKGNVINPLEKTAEYGTDALRMALTIGITPGNDGSLSDSKIAGYRNFNNKLWNVARFILQQIGEDTKPDPDAAQSDADHWIVNRLHQEISAVTKAIEEYRFSEAGERVYGLLWNDIADWYLEASKQAPNPAVLAYVLDTVLRLAHPFIPYVTEVIWHNLAWHKQNLIVAEWPQASAAKRPKAAEHFADLQKLVVAARAAKANLGLSSATLISSSPELANNAALLRQLARVDLKIEQEGRGLALVGQTWPTWLDVDSEQLAAYKGKLIERQQELKANLRKWEAQLANESYTSKAPAHLVAETRANAAAASSTLAQLALEINAIK